MSYNPLLPADGSHGSASRMRARLSDPLNDPPTLAQVQAILDNHNALVSALKRIA